MEFLQKDINYRLSAFWCILDPLYRQAVPTAGPPAVQGQAPLPPERLWPVPTRAKSSHSRAASVVQKSNCRAIVERE